MTTQDVAILIIAIGAGAFALASVFDMLGVQDWCERVVREYRNAEVDRAWARRSNTDTRVVAAYLADITDHLRAGTEAAKTRAAVETLLAAWQPVEGSPPAVVAGMARPQHRQDNHMTAEYTPSLATVRKAYKHRTPGTAYYGVANPDPEAEFDRFIASIKAEAWQKGYDAGEECLLDAENPDHKCIANPYLTGGTL